MDWPALRFLTHQPDEGMQLLLSCSHASGLVLLAYLLACVAGYATLSLVERAACAERHDARRLWSIAAAITLGGGVWCMHFIAMLAFQAPVAISYDLPTTLFSLAAVIAAALLAMRAFSHPQPSLRQRLLAALCIGLGIALMHYSGMAAMRSQAQIYYRPGLFSLSLAIALASSFAALQLALFFRGRSGPLHLALRLLASLAMGSAIASMHFTGMWAMELVVPIGTPLQLQSVANATQLGIATGVIALLSSITGLVAAWLDRQLQNKDRDLRRVNSLLDQLNEAKASLQRVAHHDPLTNLLNRRSFNEAFAAQIAEHAINGKALALMFVDIDHFKRINDSLGHDAGDQLLLEVAERIRDSLRGDDVVARLGGDEFCILASLGRLEEARSLAWRVTQRLKRPITLGRRQMVMTASIGIAIYPHDGTTCAELLKHADLALYQSKGSGRNAVHFFSEQLRNKATMELELEEELREALNKDQGLLLHYQPILDLRSNRVSKLEALVRWDHPRLGLLAPDRFIGIAEANGLIGQLDAWVLRRACHDLRSLETGHGRQDLRVAVNCSALNLSHEELVEEVEAALSSSGLSAHRLELEVTENALMGNVNQALDLLQRVRELGTSISIDDFGTGYSSLAYLTRLPLDTLKIDRSFMLDLVNAQADRQVVKAVVSMAHALELKVVAEGVEDVAQMQLLQQMGCDFIQGYLLSRPLPMAELEVFLHRHEGLRAPLTSHPGSLARLNTI